MYELTTTKEKVALIAPELLELIHGVAQKTRLYVQDTTQNTVTIDDKEYTYEVQEDDTIEDIISGLMELIDNDEDAIVSVVNDSETYFDIRGLYLESYSISGLTYEITIPSIPDSLWELFAEDIANVVNEDTFKDEIERAQRYLMAHMLTLKNSGLNNMAGVNSERVGDISVQYSDPMSQEGLGLTGYGLIYKGIWLKQRRVSFTRSC